MFPNLLFALRVKRLPQFELARLLGISESAFSRCMRGRLFFTEKQMEQVAEILGDDKVWLFEQPVSPRARAAASAEAGAA